MEKNLIEQEYIKASLKSWEIEQSKPFTKTLFKSIAHWNLVLLIAENTYIDKNYSFEKFCILIPATVASRATIQRILNELIDLGYVEKYPHHQDHRIKLYFLSTTGRNLFSDFVKSETEIYSSYHKAIAK
ncbi:MAG: hypothetical protein ISQ93_02765 [Pelagibacterales bacterium]|nr:hypothetical protein [Pelagibacterales bacterium]